MSGFFKNHEQKIALLIGFLLIAILFFNLGKFSARHHPPEIKVQEPSLDLTQIYDNLKNLNLQLALPQEQGSVAGAAIEQEKLNCEGKIKGNISSKARIYHVPGGAFYKRTIPEICFASEKEAQAAGFRKSKR